MIDECVVVSTVAGVAIAVRAFETVAIGGSDITTSIADGVAGIGRTSRPFADIDQRRCVVDCNAGRARTGRRADGDSDGCGGAMVMYADEWADESELTRRRRSLPQPVDIGRSGGTIDSERGVEWGDRGITTGGGLIEATTDAVDAV